MTLISILLNLIFSFLIIKEDLKSRKILNKILIKYCIVFFIFKMFDFYFYPIKFNYYLLQYYLLSILLPFFIYVFKVWGAGDSKLLTLYFVFLPNVFIEKYYYIYIFRYLNFLFILSCLVYLIIGLVKIIKLKTVYINKEKIFFQIKYLLFIILVLNLINSILGYRIRINIYSSIIINLVFIYIIQKFFYKFFTNRNLNIILVFLLFFNIKFINLNFLYRIIFAIFIFFIKQIIEFSEKKEVLVDDLKLRDILTIKTLELFSKSRVKNLPKLDFNSPRKNHVLSSQEELEAIKRWKNSKYGRNSIEIEKSIPFSIYICITYIISIIFYIYK